jgi:hypothetical protein
VRLAHQAALHVVRPFLQHSRYHYHLGYGLEFRV